MAAGLAFGLAIGGAAAQTSVSPSAQGPGVVTGQQNGQPIPTQNTPQMQTNMSQQPPQARTLAPTAGAQTQPNALPELSK